MNLDDLQHNRDWPWQHAQIGDWCWHIHHDILLEVLVQPVMVRAEFIVGNKPEDEHDVRLTRLAPVRRVDRIPAAVRDAGRAYAAAWKAYDEAGEAYAAAWKAYAEARRVYEEAWRAHAEAGRAYAEARKAHAAARKAFAAALAAHREAIEVLHAEECPDCPWDGETIFPRDTK